MSKKHDSSEHLLFDTETTEKLVALLNQSLADTLDLAYQTKQAHWNVKGSNFYSLHLLFDQLHLQLISYVDEFAERAVALGGQALGTIRAVGTASSLAEYPLDARDSVTHLFALVEGYGKCAGRVRKAIHKAEQMGDAGTADLYTTASRDLDKALWMLKSHLED